MDCALARVVNVRAVRVWLFMVSVQSSFWKYLTLCSGRDNLIISLLLDSLTS